MMSGVPSLWHPLQAGSLTLPGNLLLAPMAGYTDAPFRGLCLDHGADGAFTEMISCEALARGNRRTLNLAARAPGERQLLLQIFTGSPEPLSSALDKLLPLQPSLIDLNAGCPVPKIVRSGAGSALTAEPRRLEGIVAALSRLSPVPISVKIRSGWTEDTPTFREAALRAVDAGASMITLHPRSRSRGYGGRACRDHIAQLRSILPPEIPVVASGDLFTPEAIRTTLEETGCDGAMAARGSLGNPFLFERTRFLLTEGHPAEGPSRLDRSAAARQLMEEAFRIHGEERASKELRKQLPPFFSGCPGAAQMRQKLVRARTAEDYRRLLDQWETEQLGTEQLGTEQLGTEQREEARL